MACPVRSTPTRESLLLPSQTTFMYEDEVKPASFENSRHENTERRLRSS